MVRENQSGAHAAHAAPAPKPRTRWLLKNRGPETGHARSELNCDSDRCMHVCIYMYIYIFVLFICIYIYIHLCIYIYIWPGRSTWCFRMLQMCRNRGKAPSTARQVHGEALVTGRGRPLDRQTKHCPGSTLPLPPAAPAQDSCEIKGRLPQAMPTSASKCVLACGKHRCLPHANVVHGGRFFQLFSRKREVGAYCKQKCAATHQHC